MTSANEATVLVLGASGKTGRRIVPRLEQRGARVKAAHRSGPTPFDWADQSTWKAALAGVDAVYMVDPAYVDLGDAPGGHSTELIARFGELARNAGAARVVLLSARDLSRLGDPELIASEGAIQTTGLDWTILRPTWFMQNFAEMELFSEQIEHGDLRLNTGQGREPFIDVADLADVAVATLLEGRHASQIYEISGPQPLTFGEAVEAIAAATGREISFTPVAPSAAVGALAANGLSGEFAEFLAMLFDRIDEEANADLSDGVQRVLGREPRDFATYAREAAAAGAWG
jgi:uncharacterized protein YbjT (DUF2867 family)